MSVLTSLLKHQPCKHVASSMMMLATRQMSSSFGPAAQHQLTSRPSVLTSIQARSFSSSLFCNEVFNAKRASREHQPSRTVYVGNIPYTSSAGEIEQMFTSFGKIENVKMKCDEQGKNMGYAHVEFATDADAVAVVESAQEEPFWLANRTLMINFSRPATGKTRTNSPQMPSNRLFFTGFNGTTNDLRESLKKYARSITRIDFHKDRETGQLLNRGYIGFTTEEIATSVLNEMNGSTTESGFNLQLEYSRNKF